MPATLKAAGSSRSAPRASDPEIVETVAETIADVRVNGDEAVRRRSRQFDPWAPVPYRLGAAEVKAVVGSVPETVLDDLRFAQPQVRDFALAESDSLRDFEIETLPGVFLGRRNMPVTASAAYVRGWRHSLTASAHMRSSPSPPGQRLLIADGRCATGFGVLARPDAERWLR